MNAAAPERGPWLAPILIVAVGAMAVSRLASPVPAGAGAARLSDPGVLLASFDALWVVLASLPARSSRGALWATLTTALVGLPFHLAIAGAAGAAPEHRAALLLLVAAFAVAGWAGSNGRRVLYAGGLVLLTLALPLAAYALEDLLGVQLRWGLAASPLTGPALLGRAATTTSWTAAIPGAAGALILAGLARWPSRAPEPAV